MIQNEKNGVVFFTFDHFEKTGLVRHCFSSRMGGVSEGVFASLNLGYNRGDDRTRENYELLCRAVGFEYGNIVFSAQTHTTNILAVTHENTEKNSPTKLMDIDGLVTDNSNVVLTTLYADCVPLFFLDPIRKIIALSHAGWKGTVDGIATKTVEYMKNKYHSNPADMIAGIGPSIGACCFEVDRPVVDEFVFKLWFANDFITKSRTVPNKWHIHLQGINKQLLVEAGLSESAIESSQWCTKCNPKLFYSHRNMGKERGSLAAFMELL